MMEKSLIFIAATATAAAIWINLCCAQNLCEIKLDKVDDIEKQMELILKEVEQIRNETALMKGSQNAMMEQFKNVITTMDKLLDIDECLDGTDQCHINATCQNNFGSYNCSCSPGFSGDGFNCTDNPCATPDKHFPNFGCIREVNEEKNFTTAKEYCKNKGARLLEGITSRDELDKLGEEFKVAIQELAWIGLYRQKWVESGTGVDLSQDLWKGTVPNIGDDNCVALEFFEEKVVFRACPCIHNHYFLCQRKVD